MSNSIIFYIMVLLPFFVQYSLYFSERKRRKTLRQLSKLRRRQLGLKELSLLMNNVLHYPILYRGYSIALLLIVVFLGLTVGSDEGYPSSKTYTFAMFCLISVVLYCFLQYALLKKRKQFSESSIFISFLEKNSDFPPITSELYANRFKVIYVSLAIAILNLIIYILLG